MCLLLCIISYPLSKQFAIYNLTILIPIDQPPENTSLKRLNLH